MERRDGNKMKRLPAGLALLLLLNIPPAPAQAQEEGNKSVLVGLNAPYYRHKKKVKVTLFNQSKDTIWFYPEIGYLSMNVEKKDSTGWGHVDIFDIIDRTPHIIAFAPGMETEFLWDQTVIDRPNWPGRKRVSRGIYRARFTYWSTCPSTVPKLDGQDICPFYIRYSNAFEIR